MSGSGSIRQRASRGVSLLGLLFVLAVLGCVGVVAAQVIPTLIEYQAIDKAANKAKEGTTVPEVRAIFDRAQAADDFAAVSGKDLNVRRVGDRMVVSYAYEREIHLVGPAYLLLKYTGESR